MIKFLLVLLSLMPSVAYADYSAVLQQAKAQNQRIFLLFTGDNCHFCHQFEKEVLSKPEIAQLLSQKFIVYHCNVDKEPKVATIWGQYFKGIPSYFIIDGNAMFYASQEGAASLAEFKTWLEQQA